MTFPGQFVVHDGLHMERRDSILNIIEWKSFEVKSFATLIILLPSRE